MVDTYSHIDLYDIVKIDGNSNCIDCGSSNPSWASVNNGIIVCTVCCGEHRLLGNNISRIKSLILDQWSDLDIKMLKLGGNKSFQSLLDEYKVKSDLSIESKYNLVCTGYYRSILEKKTKGLDYKHIDKPNSLIGLQTLLPQAITPNESDKISSSRSSIPKLENKKSIFGKIFGYIEKAADKLTDKIKESGLDAKLTQFADKSADITEKTGNKLTEKSTDIYVRYKVIFT